MTLVAPTALVVAGGEGRRLGAIASVTPKPMLPILGKPALEHLLEQLREQGVRQVYLSVRHLAHVVHDYFGDGRAWGLDIQYLVEEAPLNTAGSIGLLPPQDGPLLVVNGDVLTPLPIADMVASHQQHAASMTVGHVEQRVQIPYGVVECVGSDISRLVEKPDIVITAVAGVYLLAPDVVGSVQPGVPLAMPDLIERVCATGRVIGYRLPGPWLDIGTPGTYAKAEQFVTACRAGRLMGGLDDRAAAVPVGLGVREAQA